jgi:hypothetical protein
MAKKFLCGAKLICGRYVDDNKLHRSYQRLEKRTKRVPGFHAVIA